MWPYLARRLLWSLVTILLITAITFVIYFVLPPVSPAVLFAGKEPTPELIHQVKVNLGLNHSLPVQYLLFVKHLFLGDKYGWPGLGFSFVNHQSVKSLLAGRIVVTLTLGLGAALFWLAIGIPIGVVSALKQRSLVDRLALGSALFFVSAPVFWLGLVFLYLFWFRLGIAAGTGYYPLGHYGFFTWIDHMLMPWIVLALLYAAWYARMIRGSVLDTLQLDFVRTARVKGISRGAGDRPARLAGGAHAGADDARDGHRRPRRRHGDRRDRLQPERDRAVGRAGRLHRRHPVGLRRDGASRRLP